MFVKIMRLAIFSLTFLVIATTSVSAQSSQSHQQGVAVLRKDDERRVDITIDGKPFTSYIYPSAVKKPVLFPLRTAAGTIVTRGYPLDPRPGERADHPHQVGAWFNYGNVNGIDFWGNSDAMPAENVKKLGTILHRGVQETINGGDRGELAVTADWVLHDGSVLLREATRFIFRARKNWRAIDRITTWTARDTRLVFNDTKEGAFGIRVARALEHPSKQLEVFTDASGKPETVPKLDNTGVNGLYRSSEGKTGDGVWGTRARWVMLTGKVENESVTLAILDHPKNVGHPTYWHARGYGLFAANPFGQKDFSGGKEVLNFTLEPQQSVTFRHRILILSGDASPKQMEAEYQNFVRSVP